MTSEFVSEAVQLTALNLEKKLCAALGRPWLPVGMSVETLVDEIIAKLTTMQDQVSIAKGYDYLVECIKTLEAERDLLDHKCKCLKMERTSQEKEIERLTKGWREAFDNGMFHQEDAKKLHTEVERLTQELAEAKRMTEVWCIRAEAHKQAREGAEQELAALKAPDHKPLQPVAEHQLYQTGDPDAPDSIKDRNGEVVLGLCKVCNKAEAELTGPCTAPAAVEPDSYCVTEGDGSCVSTDPRCMHNKIPATIPYDGVANRAQYEAEAAHAEGVPDIAYEVPAAVEPVDNFMAIWSMRPKPGTEAGDAWEHGCRQGYEWGTTTLATARQEGYEAGRREAIPEGWVAVPKEPTEAMLDAPDVRVSAPCIGCGDTSIGWGDAREVWNAMIAAAQKGETT